MAGKEKLPIHQQSRRAFISIVKKLIDGAEQEGGDGAFMDIPDR